MNKWILLVALGACLASCHRGRPARKELPEYLGALPEIPATVTPNPSRIEGRPGDGGSGTQTAPSASGYLFYSTDTSLLLQGLRRDLLVLAIPDPANDSAIGAMIAAGHALAPYLLSELRQDNKTGIVIDLRLGDHTPTIREDYLVSSPALEAQDMPVIFLWDRSSAGRAAAFAQYLEQFPGITWSLSNDRPRYQTDCFTKTHPAF